MLGDHDEPITYEHMMDLIERIRKEWDISEDMRILDAIEESVWRYNDLCE